MLILILILITILTRLVLRAPSGKHRHAARVTMSRKEKKGCSLGERGM